MGVIEDRRETQRAAAEHERRRHWAAMAVYQSTLAEEEARARLDEDPHAMLDVIDYVERLHAHGEHAAAEELLARIKSSLSAPLKTEVETYVANRVPPSTRHGEKS